MRVRKEIKKADKLLQDASQQLPLSIITPTNERSVRQQVLSNKIKNPVLKYRTPTVNLLDLRRKVSSLTIEERDVVDSFIVEKQMDIIRKIDLVNSIGCFDFTDKSVKLYGLPSASLVSKAYDVLTQPCPKSIPSPKVKSKDAIAIIKTNLEKFGLPYKVKKAELVTSAVIAANRKLIVLKKKARFSEQFINRLIVHEIGTHALRFGNGATQKLKIFANGLSQYLETEEGLAAYNEERFHVSQPSYMRNYAGRVIAVHMAQEHDFHATYKELRKYFPKKTAFQLTLRAKRGLSNTNMAGGFTKDHLYFKGYLKVKAYAEKNNIDDLYYGKIGLDDLPFLKKMRLEKPKLLPKDFVLFEEKEPIDTFPSPETFK
tara:strand:+ start:216 stop:1334 length:1119 start_codon:yes stop_codon:yes gene_type:complete